MPFSRAFLLAPVLFLASSVAATYDAYDPKALAARATELSAEGRFDAARILLDRAQRIVPGDARVARAREAIEDRVAGRSVPAEPVVGAKPAAAAPPPSTSSIEAPPPPVWKLP